MVLIVERDEAQTVTLIHNVRVEHCAIPVTHLSEPRGLQHDVCELWSGRHRCPTNEVGLICLPVVACDTIGLRTGVLNHWLQHRVTGTFWAQDQRSWFLAMTAEAPALRWAHKLAGVRSHGSELDWLGPDGAQVSKHLGAGAVAWAIEVGEAIATKISEEIPQLVHSVSEFAVLRRATTSTTLRSLMLATDIGEFDTALASAEVIEIAQDFARRGLELDDLLRSIRVGYAVLAGALLDAVIAADPHDTTELRRVSVLMFERMDDFTATAASAFITEHRTVDDHLIAARLDLARTIVAGEPVHVDKASRLLNYALSAHHIGIIASTDQAQAGEYVDLRTLVDPIVSQFEAPSARLLIPVGTHALWVWLGYRKPPSLGAIASLPKSRD